MFLKEKKRKEKIDMSACLEPQNISAESVHFGSVTSLTGIRQ